ncbi:hypothetical protein ACJX0J_033339, partial [Zea mays]
CLVPGGSKKKNYVKILNHTPNLPNRINPSIDLEFYKYRQLDLCISDVIASSTSTHTTSIMESVNIKLRTNLHNFAYLKFVGMHGQDIDNEHNFLLFAHVLFMHTWQSTLMQTRLPKVSLY